MLHEHAIYHPENPRTLFMWPAQERAAVSMIDGTHYERGDDGLLHNNGVLGAWSWHVQELRARNFIEVPSADDALTVPAPVVMTPGTIAFDGVTAPGAPVVRVNPAPAAPSVATTPDAPALNLPQ